MSENKDPKQDFQGDMDSGARLHFQTQSRRLPEKVEPARSIGRSGRSSNRTDNAQGTARLHNRLEFLGRLDRRRREGTTALVESATALRR